MGPVKDPVGEYQARLEARQAEAAHLARRQVRLGYLRLAAAGAAAVAAWKAPWLVAAPGAVFVVLVVIHERARRLQWRAGRAAAAYEQGLARLHDRWAGHGEAGERFRDRSHPYAEDLDLFGRGSLFELLSTARTRMGEHTLADWLRAPATPETVRERQAAVTDLRERLDLREDLAVLGEHVRADVHPEALVRWAEEPPVLVPGPARAAAAWLAVLAVVSVAIWFWKGLATPLAIVLALEAALAFWYRSRVLHVIHAVEYAAHDLDILAGALRRMEQERFAAPLLVRARQALESKGEAPWRIIRRLDRRVELLDSRDSLVLRLFGPPLLYTTQLALATEAWRQAHGAQVRQWLEAVGEMEALSALASYAYEHPQDPFPQLDGQGALFEGEALGHPLVPESRAVRNDIRLGPDMAVLIVSGSNMSGKSTLLRTVGINAVLAMTGAPVRARRLRLAPLTVGASIRVTDSLQEGSSRFYVEIQRLRKLVDLAAGRFPLLFLLDELLHGTNPNDRRVGADAVIRELVGRGAVGLVTTHDLALARIAEVLAPRAANVHFEDHIEDGKLLFDYRLRPGIVTKSNALELMRSIGLEV